MRIAVYGGTGMIGSRIVAEAARRGHHVTAISRSGSGASGGGVSPLAANAADAEQVAELAATHDVVVSAIGPSRTGGDHQQFLDDIATLADNMNGTRLVVVGGAASLVLPDGTLLVDAPEFPEAYKAEAATGIRSFAHLRSTEGVDWTYLSPAPEIAPGERTGRYLVGDDSPVGGSISAEDYAVALVDELEKPAHRGRRFTVAAA